MPRGVGLSSYLSELYMRDLDARMREHPDVVFYARYVDDIVVLYTAPPQIDCRSHLSAIRSLVSEKGLALNDTKTDQSPLTDGGRPEGRGAWSFEYLGYKFTFKDGLEVGLSESRRAKYKGRLAASFSNYEKQRAKNQKAAYRLLVKRVRLLAGNTQLTHNKSNAYVGIYFSDTHLTLDKDLNDLDVELRRATARLASASLKGRLNSLSFKKGFSERIFRRFHRRGEFAQITKAWSYE